MVRMGLVRQARFVVVSQDMVQSGAEWCGRRGEVRCGLLRLDMVRNGTAGEVRRVFARYGAVWKGNARHGNARYGYFK